MRCSLRDRIDLEITTMATGAASTNPVARPAPAAAPDNMPAPDAAPPAATAPAPTPTALPATTAVVLPLLELAWSATCARQAARSASVAEAAAPEAAKVGVKFRGVVEQAETNRLAADAVMAM